MGNAEAFEAKRDARHKAGRAVIEQNLDRENLDEVRLRMEREHEIMISLAGLIAEQRLTRTHTLSGADYDRAGQIAMQVCGEERVAEAFTRWLELRTRALVEDLETKIEAEANRLGPA